MNRSFQNTGMEKTTWYFKAKKSFKSMLEELDAGRKLMAKVANYTKFCRVARGNVLAVLEVLSDCRSIARARSFSTAI